MCVRYSCQWSAEEIARELGVVAAERVGDPRYNVAPQTINPIVRKDDGGLPVLEYMEWGFDRPFSTFNCRLESLEEMRPTWECARRQRAVVVMDGYYEWKYKALERVPYYFHTSSKMALALGIWENGRYSILTKPASRSAAKVHPRMPVLVSWATAKEWIGGKWPEVLGLVGQGIEPIYHRVSKRVNKVGNEGPDLVREVTVMDLGVWAKGPGQRAGKPEPAEPMEPAEPAREAGTASADRPAKRRNMGASID